MTRDTTADARDKTFMTFITRDTTRQNRHDAQHMTHETRKREKWGGGVVWVCDTRAKQTNGGPVENNENNVFQLE